MRRTGLVLRSRRRPCRGRSGLVGRRWAGGLDPGMPPGLHAGDDPREEALPAQWSEMRQAGPVLVRGRQIDGPNELRFSYEGQEPPQLFREWRMQFARVGLNPDA